MKGYTKAYVGPFSKRDAEQFAAGIIKSVKKSPYLSEDRKKKAKATIRKRTGTNKYDVYANDF